MKVKMLLLVLTVGVFLVGCGSDRPEITLAVIDQDVAKVKKLIANGANVNDQGKNNKWAPAIQYTKGNVEILTLLLENGADPNWETKNFSVLQEYCSNYRKPEPVELLIKHGAKVNYVNPLSGGTALHLAFYNCHKEIADVLINNGADLTIKDNNGMTPLAKLESKKDGMVKTEMLDFLRSKNIY